MAGGSSQALGSEPSGFENVRQPAEVLELLGSQSASLLGSEPSRFGAVGQRAVAFGSRAVELLGSEPSDFEAVRQPAAFFSCWAVSRRALELQPPRSGAVKKRAGAALKLLGSEPARSGAVGSKPAPSGAVEPPLASRELASCPECFLQALRSP